MQRHSVKPVSISSGEWSLDGDLLRVHNLHVSAGLKMDQTGCGFCGGGVAKILTPLERPTPKDGVVEGDRTDDKRSASPPRSDDRPREEESKLSW